MQFNPFDIAVRQDPYPAYAELRREDPVHRMDPMGFWIVTRYQDVQYVLKNPQLFSSEGMAGPEGLQGGVIRSIITMDPPDHGPYRTLVSRAFTPRTISALDPRVREIAHQLLSGIAHKTEFDAINGLALPLPIRVIAEMLGVEPQRYNDFKRWSDILVGMLMPQGVSPEQAAYAEAETAAFQQYFRWAIEERRHHPGDDLISALLQAEEQHQHLTVDEVFGFAGLLLVAGNETTTNLLGNMLLALLEHQDQLKLLLDDPSLIPGAIEETLRYDSPVQMLFRIAREDLELGGKKIVKGSLVWPVLGSANRDEARFPDPDRFDITRDANGHIAFGHGIHFCIGAPLARLETRIAMEALLPHLEGMRSPERPLDYIDAFFLRGLKHLPLALPQPVLASMPPSPAELARLMRASAGALAKDAYRGTRTLIRSIVGRASPSGS